MASKILIVDDEPNIIVPLQFIMERNGYDVTVAETGEAAMAAVTADKPDLILLDLMLPDLDGFDICRLIRENPDWRDIKIIMVTAMSSEVDVTKGLSLGADAFIIKPFSNSDVVRQVNEMLQGGP